jgi:hypothetical protein
MRRLFSGQVNLLVNISAVSISFTAEDAEDAENILNYNAVSLLLFQHTLHPDQTANPNNEILNPKQTSYLEIR